MNPAVSRNIIYPMLFGLRRESVFNDLVVLRDMQWHDSVIVEERQIMKFRKVAETGIQSFDFYRRLIADAGLSPNDLKSIDDIKRWPLTSKTDLNMAVQELREVGQKLPAHTLRMTGGSTGDPCLVIADRETSSRTLAARALFQEWYGIRLGDRQIRLWGHPLDEGAWLQQQKDIILNRIRLDSLALGKDRFKQTFDRIVRFGAEYLYGYASLVALFIDILDDSELEKIHDGLKAAISTSETMSELQRVKLENRLSRPIVDEYGCSEVDIIAFRCPLGGRHTAAENVLVEIVPMGDEPDGYGSVVVTDLNNMLMPVIRYVVGDLAPLAPPSCTCGRGWPCIGPILGRIQNQFIILDRGDRRVHSQFVVYMLEHLFSMGWGIGRFQIVQKEPDLLEVRIVPVLGKPFDQRRLQDSLENQGRNLLGTGMRWQVVMVKNSEFEISANQKFKHFICMLSKDIHSCNNNSH